MGGARLRAIFEPQSIAIVGASDDVNKVGGRVLESLRFNDFKGSLLPVNPGRKAIQGLTAYPSIAAIGAPADLVILSVPAKDVEAEAMRACDSGAGALLVYASGFSELGEEGRVAQQRLTDLVRGRGVPLVGPNCLGIMNGHNGMVASSTIMMQGRRLEKGKLSFVTQSGAIGVFWLDMMLEYRLGISKWVSTGNEADIDVAGVLDYLVDDPDTGVIGIYTEGIRDGHAFRLALARARAQRKPVIVLKAGRSNAGAAAVASHTGALAGDDTLYSSLFEQYDVAQVNSLGEMIDISRILATQELPRTRRTCIVSNSGGAGALLTDAVSVAGFELPALSAVTVARLKPHFPSYVQQRNPIDLTDRITSDTGMYASTLEILIDSGEFDVVFAFMAGRSAPVLEDIGGRAFGTVLPQWRGGHAAIWQSGTYALMDDLKAAHVAIFAEIPAAVNALSRAMTLATLSPRAVSAAIPRARAVARTRALVEHEGKRLLAQHSGLESPRAVMLTGASVASSLSEFRFPVVAKLQSVDMLHKTGQGGIELGIDNVQAVQEAAARMLALARERGMRCDGVLVEEMCPPVFEFVVGFRHDPTLGPFLLLGRGGVHVEVQPDVVRAFLPLDAGDVEVLFRRLQMNTLLDGFRGGPRAPVDRLAAVIARVGEWFIRDESLAEIEINPLSVDSSGRVLALDALVQVVDRQ